MDQTYKADGRVREFVRPVRILMAEGNVSRAELLAAGPVKGTQALEVEIRDSAGRRHASSGYYSLTNGAFELEIPVARNDRTGYWTVICTDLIAGHRAEAAFRVNL